MTPPDPHLPVEAEVVAVHGRSVDEVMTRDVVTVHRDASFKSVVRTLAQHRVDAVPVVDDDRRLVGVVSSSDLTCHEEPPPRWADWLTRRGRDAARKARGDTAGDLMSAPVRTVAPEATVGAALREMARHHVGRLVVTDARGIAGILTRSDLLRVFLRDDEEIRADVLQALAPATAGCPQRISVQVDDGVVRLTGWMELRSAAWRANAAARGVAGVVQVVDDLECDVDDTAVHELATRGPFV